MNNSDDFMGFFLKHKGAIIGGLIAIIIVAIGLHELIIGLIVIAIGILVRKLCSK